MCAARWAHHSEARAAWQAHARTPHAGRCSPTVEANEDLACYVLTERVFEGLAREHQPIATRLLKNLGRELSRRLRRADQTIYELES